MRLLFALASLALTALIHWLFRTPLKLAEDAVIGWINRQIGERFDLSGPALDTVVYIGLNWGLPFCLAILVLYLYHLAHSQGLGKAQQLKWSSGRTRFRIWEAACFIHDIKPSEYKTNDQAQSTASEIVYYVGRGQIGLAGETRTSRVGRALVSDIKTAQVDENSYLDASTVRELKGSWPNLWLDAIDKANRSRGF